MDIQAPNEKKYSRGMGGWRYVGMRLEGDERMNLNAEKMYFLQVNKKSCTKRIKKCVRSYVFWGMEEEDQICSRFTSRQRLICS